MISMFVTQELNGLKNVLEVQGKYMQSLPMRDWYGTNNSATCISSGSDNESWFPARTRPWPEADALKKATMDVAEWQVKIQSELRYAKREVSWGKLGPKDMATICRLLRNILVPILGLESLTGIADRIEKRGGWGSLRVPMTEDNLSESESKLLEVIEKGQWEETLGQLNGRVKQLQQAMIEGFNHALYTLELARSPLPRARADLEANSVGCLPGERGFAECLENMIRDFLSQREGPLKEWCSEKRMDDPSQLNGMKPSAYSSHERHQSQLYLILDVCIFTAS
jgi:hypothetical protein